MKQVLVAAALAVLLLGPAPVAAHPADSIAVEYDSTGYLSVGIRHPIRGEVDEHYIGKVVVKLNGTEIIRQSFRRQVDSEWQQAVYLLIDLKPDDKVQVTTTCNLYGNLSRTFVPLSSETGEQ
jgi:desulfoferrodoxin (superoxide reductase-like protein)